MYDRPTGVTIISVLMMIGGVSGVIGGCIAMSSAGSNYTSAELQFAIGFFTTLSSIFSIAIAVGLWRLERWALRFATAFTVVTLAIQGFSLLNGSVSLGTYIGVLVQIGYLTVLLNDDVRNVFAY